MSDKISRPIANFHPCHWGDHFLDTSNPRDEVIQVQKEREVKQLQEEVKELLATKSNAIELLNFIDAIESLGVSYNFEEEIEEALKQVYESFDAFRKFKDEKGSFKESLKNDIPGLLSLFEATHVGVRNDKILDVALEFTTTNLKAILNQLSSPLLDQVAHALDQPLHKGMPRVESRHYISVYEKDPLHNTTLLKFVKLDCNLLQALHQKELKDLRRWWKELHLNASFSRDRLTEAYFWILGVYYEPQYSFARKVYRKLFKLTSLLDDTYDSYGTIEELQLLTETFQRSWDISFVDKLPEHVKWCYYGNVKACEEVEEELAKDERSFCVNKIREQVLCEAYLQEAKWCDQKYIPTYDEYMKVALVTSPYPHAAVASFLGMGEIASNEVFDWACQNPMPNVIKAAFTIIRLMNDTGGHKYFEQRRNHVASAVQCLLEKHGIPSEEKVNKKLRAEIDDAWKQINEAMLQPYVVPKPILIRILNLARSADVIYKGDADGYTNVNQTLKDKVASVIAHPIPV